MIYQNKSEEEDRQHKHMNELRHKTPEKPWNLGHFNHFFGVTKIVIIFFSHK
jgi:hypothetical protein